MARTITVSSVQAPGIRQYLNPISQVRALWQHRELIRQFTRREIEGRYRGSFLGVMWPFVTPLISLLIYTFVFGVVFKARWPNSRTTGLAEFALILFCGLTTFTIFSETIGRASNLVTGVPNYVKKVVFPLEVLLVNVLGAALFHGLISLSILLVANLLVNHTLHWTLLLLPVVALPLIFLSLGIGWFLSSLGVFVRDINYVITLLIQVLFYSSAIMYPLEQLPQSFQIILRLNPLTSIIENFRRVILWGIQPSWVGLLLWIGATGLVMMLGYTWFMATKKGFADVL